MATDSENDSGAPRLGGFLLEMSRRMMLFLPNFLDDSDA
jgi:hypothetical protein